MSQALTMPLGKCRDKFLPWDFGVPEKSSKVIHWLADCDSVQRGREAAGTRETPQRFSSGMDAVFCCINRLTVVRRGRRVSLTGGWHRKTAQEG
jgi:hypothetical protein